MKTRCVALALCEAALNWLGAVDGNRMCCSCSVLRLHLDVRSSNILFNHDLSGKLFDFGLAKLFELGESHINTRFMGMFEYVALEYANTGVLNEKSDIYSIDVLFMESVTGMDPLDYNRGSNEFGHCNWFKTDGSAIFGLVRPKNVATGGPVMHLLTGRFSVSHGWARLKRCSTIESSFHRFVCLYLLEGHLSSQATYYKVGKGL